MSKPIPTEYAWATCEKCGKASIVRMLEFYYGKTKCPHCKKRMNTLLERANAVAGGT